MFRWLACLCVLALATGLMSVGVIPTEATGMVRVLCVIYLGLIAVTLTIGAIRG